MDRRGPGGCGKHEEKEQELEQLTKELRQVNLQQFIQQTGTKVTVLPAQPAGESHNGTDLRTLQSVVNSSLNPEGIYV
ncbi:Ras association domain-containing protein 8 [Liparis tanakae]|uniref:Ras association domain-containing protein 8 n=1 Tax=Liparis tanakae TaxID=230148 RepID=A0A4Z2IC58_9TELE|nr:Ras association domain-containing protein 8 [Liparis tanakae]